MFFVVCNRAGGLMCFLPMIAAAFAWVYLPRAYQDSWTLVGGWAVIVLVWDFVYRLVNRGLPWYSIHRGGHLYFIPTCLLAGLALWWYIGHAHASGYWLPHTTPDPKALHFH